MSLARGAGSPDVASTAQARATAKYDAANTKQVKIKLNKRTDKDILDRLEKEVNVQGYIKRIIRENIKEDP